MKCAAVVALDVALNATKEEKSFRMFLLWS